MGQNVSARSAIPPCTSSITRGPRHHRRPDRPRAIRSTKRSVLQAQIDRDFEFEEAAKMAAGAQAQLQHDVNVVEAGKRHDPRTQRPAVRGPPPRRRPGPGGRPRDWLEVVDEADGLQLYPTGETIQTNRQRAGPAPVRSTKRAADHQCDDQRRSPATVLHALGTR